MLGENIAPNAEPQAVNESKAEVYDDGRLHIEFQGFYVECAGRPFYDLARKEFFLLACLARHAGRVVSHDTLWAAAWPEVQPVNPHTLRVHVGTLRRKLTPFGIEIASVIHLGYRLITAQQNNLTELPGSTAVSEPSLSNT
jgi:DNA-binding response OmpR family regulator